MSGLLAAAYSQVYALAVELSVCARLDPRSLDVAAVVRNAGLLAEGEEEASRARAAGGAGGDGLLGGEEVGVVSSVRFLTVANERGVKGSPGPASPHPLSRVLCGVLRGA